MEFIKLSWKPVSAGILDIISGAIGMVGGLYFVVLSSIFRALHQNLGGSQLMIEEIEQFISSVFAIPFVLMFIGIAAIIGDRPKSKCDKICASCCCPANAFKPKPSKAWAFSLAGSLG